MASFAVDVVVALGSDTVFSITGGMAMHLNRAVATHPGLRAVYCHHEQAAVAAAEGYAKAADFRRAGFAVVTAGPGVSNTVTSLISAYGDSVPLVVLAGQIKTDDIDVLGTRTHGIQEVRSRQLVTPCVKRFERIGAADHRQVLVDTLAEAFTGRPGPVFIEFPLDVQGIGVDYDEADVAAAADAVRERVAAAARPSADALTEALAALLGAARPLLYVGNGCRVAGVEDAVAAFARRHRLPAVFSWLSFDILPGTDEHHFGCPGGLAPISANRILQRADVIVFLGARLDLGTTAFQRAGFGDRAERFFVDVDAVELAKFAGLPGGHPVAADLRDLPGAVAAAEAGRPQGTGGPAGEPGWWDECVRTRSAYLAEERARLGAGPADAPMSVYALTGLLSAWSAGKVFVPASSGYAEETFSRFFVPGAGTRVFNGAALGAMGMGLPQALGASFGSGRRVVCLEADGGIMLNLQELATLAHHAPPGFVLFILNNRGYESIRSSQERFFGEVSGADPASGLSIPDFAGVAAAFGLPYRRVVTTDALASLLDELDGDRPPVVVDLVIGASEYRGPSVRTVMGPDGRPSSTPLSEISW